MLKRTSLYEEHRALGARLIEFGGWEMPVQYVGIVEEHLAVRSSAGIFDISHMGEIYVRGPSALSFLNQVLTNNVAKLTPGLGQYTQMCRRDGGTVDDLYVFLLDSEEYLLIVNASRIQADETWLAQCLREFSRQDEVRLENSSDALSAIAVQGPKVVEFIDSCFEVSAEDGPCSRPSRLKKNQILKSAIGSDPVLVARTGYTGEDGFEIVAPNTAIRGLWGRVLEVGARWGIKPAGLGARDTLRTEACYPLYGHELGDGLTPIEAGLGFFVAFDKGEFNGRSALLAQKQNGCARKLVAFRMTERSAPPRPHYPMLNLQGERVGEVSSGTQSPTLGVGIGLGFVDVGMAKVGTALNIEIRGRPFPASIVSKPFYKASALPQV